MTPDAVELDLDVATLGSRGAAYVLDLAIFGSVLGVLSVSQAVLGASGFVPGWFGIALLLVLAFTWQFGYPIGFEVLARGRTPGKAVLGLRVVTVDGAPVRLRHAVVRATVGTFELLGTLGGIAVISSFISARGQRLGDLAAGTLVVRERRGRQAPAAEVFVAPGGFENYVARLDVSALRAEDYAMVRETLLRARELPQGASARLAADVAARLVGRVRPAPPPECGPNAFLACVAAAVQARRRTTMSGTSAPAPAPPTVPGPPPAPAPPGDAPAPHSGGFAPPN